MNGEPTFSVIIPSLNEAETIEKCVESVQASAPEAEIIIVDGGSDDTTLMLAHRAGARTVLSAPGRGIQANAGAAVAEGDILIFLHADTVLPSNAFALLRRYFQKPKIQIGTFRLTFDRSHWLFSLYTFLSRFDCVFTTFGDQCIVIRRRFFHDLGGFPDWPLFEDVRLLQKARARTTVHSFPAPITTSSRRFEREGIIRQSLRNGWYVLQYLMGVSPEALAEKYERQRTGG